MNLHPLRQRQFFGLALSILLAVTCLPVFAQDQAAENAAANKLFSDGDYAGAVQAFGQFVKNYPTSTIVSDAELKLGYSYMLSNQPDQAVATFKTLLAPPTPPETTELALGLIPQALAAKANALPATDSSRTNIFKDAIKAFSDFEAKYPKNDMIENNRYTQAICYYQTVQYDPAIEKLRANDRDFPKSESIQDSEYLLGLLLATKAGAALNVDRTATAANFPLYDESQKILQGIITRKTDLPLASDAQFQLGEVLFSKSVFSTGTDKTQLLAASMAAYRAVESNDVVLKEQQAKINALRARQPQVLATKNTIAIQRLQAYIGRETGKLEAIKGKASQRVAGLLKMAQIFYQLSTPEQPRYDETRVLLEYLEPLANDSQKKTVLYFKTMTYALQSNVDKATAGFNAFQTAYPGDPSAENLPLAMGAMLTTTNPNMALEYFKKQVELYPKSPATAAALVEQAKAYSQLQQFDLAIKTFQDYLATKPEKSMALQANLGLGDIYRTTGKLDEADAIYSKIQTDYADNKPAVAQSAFWHAWILAQDKKDQEAMTAFAKFIATYPKDENLTPNALFTYALVQKDAGAMKPALDTFQKLVTEFPKSDAASFTYFQRHDFAMEANQPDVADAAMKEFIASPDYAQDPKVFNAFTNLAQNQIAQNKTDKAIEIYQDFIAKNGKSPLIPSVYLQISSLYANIVQTLGRYAGLDPAGRKAWEDAQKGTVDNAEKVITDFPESAEVATAARSILDSKKLSVANSLLKNDDIKSYFTDFAAKFGSAPKTKSKIIFTLASFIYERGDKAEALKQMEAAYDPSLVYAPSDLDLYGEALLDQKKIDDAQKVFEKLVTDYPNPPGVDPDKAPLAIQEAQSIALYGMGKVYLAQGQGATAATNFEKLKTVYPWSSKIFEANFGIAQGLYGEKKYDDAIKLVDEIVKSQTASNELRAKAMVLGGKIRRDQGQLPGAIDYFIKTDFFYEGVPESASEGLFLGAQTMETQAPNQPKPEDVAKMKSDAVADYKKVVQKYPDTAFAKQAQDRLKALGQ